MNWDPNSEGVKELVQLLKESLGKNNMKHREIAEVLKIIKIMK